MTAATLPARRARFPLLFVVGLVAVAGLLFVSVPPLNQHAIQRHGDMAVACRDAIIGCDSEDSDYFEGVTPEGTIYRILKVERLGQKTVWVVFITIAVGITKRLKAKKRKVVERTVTTYTMRKPKRVQALKDRCR